MSSHAPKCREHELNKENQHLWNMYCARLCILYHYLIESPQSIPHSRKQCTHFIDKEETTWLGKVKRQKRPEQKYQE